MTKPGSLKCSSGVSRKIRLSWSLKRGQDLSVKLFSWRGKLHWLHRWRDDPAMGRKTEGGRNRVRNRGSSQVQAEELRERQYPGRKHIMYLYSNTEGKIRTWTGQVGRQPVPPQLPGMIVQSNLRHPDGSGPRGRGRWNQKKPRAAVMAAQVDEGEGWPKRPGGSSARCRAWNRRFSASGAGKLIGPRSGLSGVRRGHRGQEIQSSCTPEKQETQHRPERDVREVKRRWIQRLERRRYRRALRAENKEAAQETPRGGHSFKVSSRQLGETPARCVNERKEDRS